MAIKKKISGPSAPALPSALDKADASFPQPEDGQLVETTEFADMELGHWQTRKVRFDGVLFRNVSLSGAVLPNAEFLDVIFENCDLSNMDFQEGALHRVSFRHCKLLGTNFTDSVWRDVTVEECNLGYAALRFNDWRHVQIRQSSMAHADCYHSSWQHTQLETVKLEQAILSGTALLGIDLSSCDFLSLSAEPEDLKGCVIDASQAGLLAPLFGLVIKE
ncbi:pentapeptide repeat-containing protein [Paenibacillus sp. YN15]|uniref:pentapeptide repeat-containing protein n=1 Tax=Paenibacillus sp. YN15 TaxID=1742774 RepID=UPI000DCE8A5F|nr:pentapeptide repeat-containing protein [Paenibacillus sp. YN15]RAV06326.1 pentapeptide repeat-containing protein [Paenibacillus sp. YN15]